MELWDLVQEVLDGLYDRCLVGFGRVDHEDVVCFVADQMFVECDRDFVGGSGLVDYGGSEFVEDLGWFHGRWNLLVLCFRCYSYWVRVHLLSWSNCFGVGCSLGARSA